MSDAAEIHVVFVSDRFNCSQPLSHYINACCYGDDLATWLREKLRSRGYDVDEPGQEDWGWYLHVARRKVRWFIAIGATQADDAHATSHDGADELRAGNLGEWRIIIRTQGNLWQRLKRENQIAQSDELVQDVKEIVESELQVSSRIEDAGAH